MQSGGGGGGDCSMSTIAAEMVTGSHVLTVSGYSGTKGLGVGKSIDSATFNVGGHTWCIRYFPNGLSNFTSYICFDLFLRHPAAGKGEAKGRCTFSLLDQAGEPVTSYTQTSGMITFSSTASSLFRSSIETSRLELSSHIKDDSFCIRYDVSVVKEIHAVAAQRQSLTVPPPDLQHQLSNLLANEVGGDVMFDVCGETFTAHRYILAARSSVFMAELFGPTKEKKEARVRIDDMEAGVFKAMLHFIYTDTLPETDEGDKIMMAQHMLVAADRYNLQRLKVICEDMLLNSICTSMVATTLAIAEQHGCHALKEACFEFLKLPGNLKGLMASDGFQHLKISCPSVLEELLKRVAS
ncbi:hypothetical protein ACP70R_007690 [Stipagrostis hirtigluma subsp. patula]